MYTSKYGQQARVPWLFRPFLAQTRDQEPSTRTTMEQNRVCWASVRKQTPEQNRVLLGLPRPATVAAGGSPTERRTESLLGNSQTEGHLLGPSVREQAPNRTPFCSAPLLVCLVVQFLYCQEPARVTALLIMINELLKV